MSATSTSPRMAGCGTSARTVLRVARTNGFNSELRVPTAPTSGSLSRHTFGTTHGLLCNEYPTLLRPLRLLQHSPRSRPTTSLVKQERPEDTGRCLRRVLSLTTWDLWCSLDFLSCYTNPPFAFPFGAFFRAAHGVITAPCVKFALQTCCTRQLCIP